MGVVAKRSSMTFYSGSDDHYSHRVRIVLAEKGVAVDIIEVGDENRPEELADLNPYNSVPTLLDRDLVLYESKVMMEYLDERFPHPPLLPVYPVARAQSRLWMHRIEREWCPLVEEILSGSKKDAERAKSPPKTKAAAARKGEDEGLLAGVQGWLREKKQATERASAPKPDPDDVPVLCQSAGRTQYVRKSDCLLRGGRIL